MPIRGTKTRNNESTTTHLQECSSAASDRVRHRHGVGTIEGQEASTAQRDRSTTHAPTRPSIPDLKCAVGHSGRAAGAVAAQEDRRARADLQESPRSRDRIGSYVEITPVEGKGTRIGDRSCPEGAVRAARSDLQGIARVDGRGARVAVATGQRETSNSSKHRERPRSADVIGDGIAGTSSTEGKGRVVGHVAGAERSVGIKHRP